MKPATRPLSNPTSDDQMGLCWDGWWENGKWTALSRSNRGRPSCGNVSRRGATLATRWRVPRLSSLQKVGGNFRGSTLKDCACNSDPCVQASLHEVLGGVLRERGDEPHHTIPPTYRPSKVKRLTDSILPRHLANRRRQVLPPRLPEIWESDTLHQIL